MGSGDPSGLQNRRELALLALVSSTLTRFRHYLCGGKEDPSTRCAQDFGSRLIRRESNLKFDSHTLLPYLSGVSFGVCQGSTCVCRVCQPTRA